MGDVLATFNKRRIEMNEALQEDERVTVDGQAPCRARNREGFSCTRPIGHAGGHVAHVVRSKQIVARWEDD